MFPGAGIPVKNSTTCIVLAGILAAGMVWWRLGAKSAAAEVVLPAERAKAAVSRGFMARLRGVWRRAETGAENQRLKREVAMLAMVRQDNERTMAENSRLRKLLGYAPAGEGRWIFAPVLSHGGASGSMRVIRAGRGSLDGVKANAAVAVPEGLVGRVASVSPHTCEILLLTDPTSNVACEIMPGDGRKGRIFGILSGTARSPGGGNGILPLTYAVDPLLIRHLGADAEIPPRAPVVTSGRGGIFPPGLTVGYLLSSRVDSTGLERDGDVAPAVDFAGLEDVLIRHEK